MPPRTHLIDVRSPAEFSSIPGLPGAINLEYTQISTLPSVTGAEPQDAVTLYCASGGRSAFALRELQQLGFTNARNLGALENARGILEAEKAEELEHEVKADGTSSSEPTAAQPDQPVLRVTGTGENELKESWDKLLDGLAKEEGKGSDDGATGERK